MSSVYWFCLHVSQHEPIKWNSLNTTLSCKVFFKTDCLSLEHFMNVKCKREIMAGREQGKNCWQWRCSCYRWFISFCFIFLSLFPQDCTESSFWLGFQIIHSDLCRAKQKKYSFWFIITSALPRTRFFPFFVFLAYLL